MSENTLRPIARTHYFTGESLLTDDFICEQHYNMQMLALHNSSLHTWGIASGLDVRWTPDAANQVQVDAGMAIDRLGRQIVLATPQVLRVTGSGVNAFLYLVIRYHEVYDELSTDNGVTGYKRVVQQPAIMCVPTLQDPGIDILLAVVSLSAQNAVNALSFKQGRHERRYVGARLGRMQLITEGTVPDTGAAPAEAARIGVSLVARRDDTGTDDHLSVQAGRSVFSGMLTTRDSLGIGIDQPQALLQVDTIVNTGIGGMSTQGQLLTLQQPIHPPLRSGDVVIPQLPVGAAPPRPAQAVIAESTSNPSQYRIREAFQDDLLVPTRFRYMRSTLVSVSAGDRMGDLLSISMDGGVGLGTRAGMESGVPGPAALSITPERRVGIALPTGATPRATLDVRGDVMAAQLTCAGSVTAAQLTCNGVLRAQSFEGNGSGLKNLPILSYWTKQDVASAYSAIYYDTGNVGVQMVNPPASLSVGTGRVFIGSGLLSALAEDVLTLEGTQTLFTTEVNPGDSIVLGSLIPQSRRVRQIINDTTLELEEQFSIVLHASAFSNAATVANQAPTGGVAPSARNLTGTISSNGVVITGAGTRFATELRPGDMLQIAEFKPNSSKDNNQHWRVAEVIDDTHIKMVNLDKTPIPANVSAYMVTQSMIALFQRTPHGNADAAPAMLITNNGEGADNGGTVAINMPLDQVDSRYALQVKGEVNFSGGSGFDNLVAGTLTVDKWASFKGPGNAGAVLQAGPDENNALLTVKQTNVVIGSSTGSCLLEVGGDVNAAGRLNAAAAQINGTLTSGALEVGKMTQAGNTFNENGSVSLFAARVPITIDPTTPTATGIADTDGFVEATIGTLSTNFDKEFLGMLTCTAGTQNSTTAITYATASTTRVVVPLKKGDEIHHLPVFGIISLPVRKGETWSLTLQTYAQWKPVPDVTAYWLPIGQARKAAGGVALSPDNTRGDSDAPTTSGAAQLRALGQIAAIIAQRASEGVLVPPPTLDAQQRTIDQRVDDLTRVLGDAVGMSTEQDARSAFAQRLGRIVCSAGASDTQASLAPKQHVDALIDMFSEVTGKTFDDGQRTLLDQGIRALESINADVGSRGDIDLIRRNINLFLDHMQQVMSVRFDAVQLRLLTRALARLVGDGTQAPYTEAADGTGP